MCLLWTLRHFGQYDSLISLSFSKTHQSMELSVLATQREQASTSAHFAGGQCIHLPKADPVRSFFFSESLEGCKCCVGDFSLRAAAWSSEAVAPGAALTGPSESAPDHRVLTWPLFVDTPVEGAFLTFPASQFPFP